jgi:hypothetical protein
VLAPSPLPPSTVRLSVLYTIGFSSPQWVFPYPASLSLFAIWLRSQLRPSHLALRSPKSQHPYPLPSHCAHATSDSPLTSQTGGEFIAQALARNRMQSAEVAQAAAKLDADRVASEVHFVPTHLQAVTA